MTSQSKVRNVVDFFQASLAALAIASVFYSSEADAQELKGVELQKAIANIETLNGVPVAATATELSRIKAWCVNSLSNDARFIEATLALVEGRKPEKVRYSAPKKLQEVVPTVANVEAVVQLPPGAKKWTWSSGGRGVEGYEAVFLKVEFKDGRNQILYFHRNFEKIDHKRTRWE